jgi:succinoglycan biosynthesis transport protein ExoP
MGEITEALRRARDQRSAEHERPSRPSESPPESPVARAGLDPATAVPIREPAPAPLPGPVPSEATVAAISRDRGILWPARAVLVGPREPYTERFRRFAVRVREELGRRQRRSVIITSGQRAEGKTFTSCNLALALASLPVAGRIALIDLDLRRPSAARALGVTPRVGIDQVISGAATLDAARMRTDSDSLDLYLMAKPAAQAHQLLAHPRLAELLSRLEEQYDAVIIDSPPALLVPDVSMILSHVGGCIVVVRVGATRLRNTRDMFDQLPQEKLIGAFANDITLSHAARQYDYYAAEDEGQS